MDTAIAVREVAPVVWTQEQVDLLKRTIAKDATDDELAFFMHVCQHTRLDPFRRQIHFIKRMSKGESKVTFQTGIDGYRAIADDTGLYAGNDEPVFAEKIGDKFPLSASVTVYKLVNGEPRPFSATAYWSEYYPGESNDGWMWRKMPRGQLAKCAEALAFRKAFPQKLSNVYTHEEMAQANRPVQYIGSDDENEESQRLDMLVYVKQKLDDVVRPLKHAGIWNEILFQSFNVTNKDMPSLSHDALKSGIMLFNLLIDDLAEKGMPDNLSPSEWVQSVIRKMADNKSTVIEPDDIDF